MNQPNFHLISDAGRVFTWGQEGSKLGRSGNNAIPGLVQGVKGKKVREISLGSNHCAAVTGMNLDKMKLFSGKRCIFMGRGHKGATWYQGKSKDLYSNKVGRNLKEKSNISLLWWRHNSSKYKHERINWDRY